MSLRYSTLPALAAPLVFPVQIFEKHNVRVLGTQIPVIMATEDRDVFGQKLREINEKLAQSICASTMEEAIAAAEKVCVSFWLVLTFLRQSRRCIWLLLTVPMSLMICRWCRRSCWYWCRC